MDDFQWAVSAHELQQLSNEKAGMPQFYRFGAGKSVQAREQGRCSIEIHPTQARTIQHYAIKALRIGMDLGQQDIYRHLDRSWHDEGLIRTTGLGIVLECRA